jgi:hypothetical protein
MKKIILTALISLSFNTYSGILEKYECTNGNLKLEISVHNYNEQKYVQWGLSLINDDNTRIDGAGPWQKEIDSEDAFSSYNDDSAVSYKNKRAVFVSGSNLGEAILFSTCESL